MGTNKIVSTSSFIVTSLLIAIPGLKSKKLRTLPIGNSMSVIKNNFDNFITNIYNYQIH